jgi:hypothetical protein
MRTLLLALPLLLQPVAAGAQILVPPEVVRLENVKIDDDMKTVYVGNANNHYVLYCSIKAAGCVTPEADKNYLLFNKDTNWKMPGAKDFINLAFMQGWTVTYNQGENIGLIPERPGGSDTLGMYLLDATGGGYERDTIISDGPIIYGTDLSNEDRAKAWKYFFMMVVEASGKQQGADALGVKLARRCQPGEDFCTTAIDANLVGIGGIQEPRKVLVIVATDVHDQNKQIARTVCTWPAKGTQVCRDWDTGKLMTGDMAQ